MTHAKPTGGVSDAKEHSSTHSPSPAVKGQPAGPAGVVLALQQNVGNRAACQMIQAKLEVSRPGDPLEEEADQVAHRLVSGLATGPISRAASVTPTAEDDEAKNQGSAPPESAARPPVLDGNPRNQEEEDLSPEVRRATDTATADGITSDAEKAVLAASHSVGSALPDPLRRHFESASGADLGAVRIHTGPASAAASKAICARAYTIGQDIHFNEGQYHPETPEGRFLLGHEVAHTLQHQGSSSPQPVQGKGRSASAVSAEIRRVQRYSERIPILGMGSGTGPSIITISPLWGGVDAMTETGPRATPGGYLDFASGRIETVTLDEDITGGRARLQFMETANINNLLVDDVQWATWEGVVPFTVSGEQVNFSPCLSNDTRGGNGAQLAVTVAGGSTAGGGYVTFAISVTAAGSVTTGGSITGGASAGVTGSGGVTATRTSTLTGGATRSFTINLRTTPPTPIASPDVSFQVGSDRLMDGQEAAIGAWFERLPASAKDMIRNGRRPVSISGYASTTGRPRANRDLSERRARVVERILRGHAGSSAQLNVFFFGEDNTRTPDEREDPRWRRATIAVQAPNRMAPAVPGPAAPPATR